METCVIPSCAFITLLKDGIVGWSAYLDQIIFEIHNKFIIFFPLIFAIMSACVASFGCLFADRWAKMHGLNGHKMDVNLSISSPPSHCNHCGENLSFKALIPVIGYMLLNGRCEHCYKKVPIFYPIVELSSFAFMFLFIIWKQPSVFLFLTIISLWFSLVIALTDLETHEIPDRLSVPLCVIGLIFSPYEADPMNRILGMIVVGGCYMVAFSLIGSMKRINAYSMGDVIFSMALGAWLGICFIPMFMLLTSIIYASYAIPFRAKGKIWNPMGPALAVAYFLTPLFPSLL